MNRKRRTQLAVALFSVSVAAQFLLMTAPGASAFAPRTHTARQESDDWSWRQRPRHALTGQRSLSRLRPAHHSD